MKKIERLGEYISEYSVRNKDNEDIQVYGREQILRLQRGGALKHINVKELENSHLLVPPMDLQKRFADFINYTDKSKLAIYKIKKHVLGRRLAT